MVAQVSMNSSAIFFLTFPKSWSPKEKVQEDEEEAKAGEGPGGLSLKDVTCRNTVESLIPDEQQQHSQHLQHLSCGHYGV